MSSSAPTNGTKAVPSSAGATRETGVVVRDVDGREPAVGRLDRGKPLLAHQRRQAALERAEQPLHATPALRAVARDVRDAELLEPAWCTDHGCGRTDPDPVRVRR